MTGSRKIQGRSQETRERLFATALELFSRKGFEKTTMREIAQEAGLALGASYYHFKSKEEIVLELYRRTQSDDSKILIFFQQEKKLSERLQFLIRYRMDQFRPYRKSLWVLASAAVSPGNPLSPFSQDSREIRELALEAFRALIKDADPAAGPLAEELHYLLWLYQLGILLFWVLVEDEKKTQLLLSQTSSMIALLIKALKLPPLRPLARRIVTLVQTLRD
ncbi:MAG: TetR/AcrR family transcriptional regulator [Spirochaetales bacterium]|nr:TetR/AcrR family transcriptional regulator [Spirochaetales bacterium]